MAKRLCVLAKQNSPTVQTQHARAPPTSLPSQAILSLQDWDGLTVPPDRPLAAAAATSSRRQHAACPDLGFSIRRDPAPIPVDLVRRHGFFSLVCAAVSSHSGLRCSRCAGAWWSQAIHLAGSSPTPWRGASARPLSTPPKLWGGKERCSWGAFAAGIDASSNLLIWHTMAPWSSLVHCKHVHQSICKIDWTLLMLALVMQRCYLASSKELMPINATTKSAQACRCNH
jgi:hypothetical protein